MAEHSHQRDRPHNHAIPLRKTNRETILQGSRKDNETRHPRLGHVTRENGYPEVAIESWLSNLNAGHGNAELSPFGEPIRPKIVEANHDMRRLSHHRKVENSQREASGHGYPRGTRLTSDDSSLIMPAAPKPIKYNDSDARSKVAPKHVDSEMPSERKRKRDEGRPNDDLRTVENYEKRKRHKTKADRYEAKNGQAADSRRSDDRKKRSEKTKRSQVKKSSRRTGEDLARNFASSKVANERLTIRPGTGIFKNGKASSPNKKHGIPDLAFSEMQFLKTSRRHERQPDCEPTVSKHQKKKQQERERSRQEISEFFAPKVRSETSASALRPMVTPSPMPSDALGETVSNLSIPSESQEGDGRSVPSSSIFQQRKPSAMIGNNAPKASNKEISDTTSYVSWSETSQSDQECKAKRSPENNNSSSSTASEVRRRLFQTGVLDDWIASTKQAERLQHKRIGRSRSECSNEFGFASRGRLEDFSDGDEVPSNTLPSPNKLNRPSTDQVGRIAATRPSKAFNLTGGTPRSHLAEAAYMRRPVSAIPRRPATTLPVVRSKALDTARTYQAIGSGEQRTLPGQIPTLYDSCFGQDFSIDDAADLEDTTQYRSGMPPSMPNEFAGEDHGMLDCETIPTAGDMSGADFYESWEEPYPPQQQSDHDAYGEGNGAEPSLDGEYPQSAGMIQPAGYLDYLEVPRGRSFFQQLATNTATYQEEELIPPERLKGFWT